MRENTNNGKRKAPSEKLEIKRKFILFFEGIVTEVQYFNGVKDNIRKLGISQLIDIHVMERDPKDVMRANIITMISDVDELKKQNRCGEPFDGVNFDDGDKLWIIFDRDSIPENQIDEAIKYSAENKNHFLGFTNPCFELWLLLHILDISTQVPEEKVKIKSNDKVTKNYNYIGKKLSDFSSDALFRKKHINFNFYVDKVHIAIKNEMKIENEIVNMKDNLGSNIGQLFTDIFNN